MHYVSAENLGKTYGIKPLFSGLSFNLEEGDKVALVARNGSGKSTLLKILAGKETPDQGKIWINKEVTVAFLEQDPAFMLDLSILDNIFNHPHPVLDVIKHYESVSEGDDMNLLTAAIARMDEVDAWSFDAKVKQILSKLNISHLQQPVGNLSGGQRKRAALAKTLIDIGFEPRHILLVLDEPTNHLDVEMVEWLERYLNQEKITLLLVTHDRYFLDTVCDEIWELSGNDLQPYKGKYENYLEKKAAKTESELASISKAKNTYRQELEWMRKQPKARTTKSKSRQDNFYLVETKAKQLIEETQVQLQVKMNRLGGKIAELKKLNKAFGDKIILKGFDYTFKKGERVGIVGKNGVGKSTFINILQGIELPDSGKVNIGETIVFGYYSQQGLVVKDDQRVIEWVKDIAENFPLADGGSLSATQFLNLFLFPADQQYAYISTLSGGERRRLHLLSILFRNPNFLILDEPTNDLDLPTLGVLEQFLSEYQGCLLIVSHDRYFMDRLVDHLLVMEGDAEIRDFPGNYAQYRIWQKGQGASKSENPPQDREPATRAETNLQSKEPKPTAKKQLSYKEKREFDLLDKEIKGLNTEKDKIHRLFSEGNLPVDEWNLLSARMATITGLLDQKELRWLEISESLV